MPRVDRARLLVERGYFPSQLPPVFHTQDLGPCFADLVLAWTPIGKQKPKLAKWELFSVARAGHQRRATALVNPVPQVLLSAQLATYWPRLVRHFRTSRISASHPRFLTNGRRAACIPPMRPLYDKRRMISAGFKFVLRSDVSRFFPTIYTHSIPWALHTKSAAKQNRARISAFYGNILDNAVQQCQDGQTLGLPVGPDSSHIIAEAVVTAVDQHLRQGVVGRLVGLRYVDDIYLFFASRAEAEDALAHLTRALREFELQINFDKTSIKYVWDTSEDQWPHLVRGMEIASEGRRQRSDINRFFEFLEIACQKNADENVAVYGLKRAAGVLIRPDNWSLFESHVCHLAMAHPNAIDYVARVLSTYHQHSYPLNLVRLARLCNQLIADHAGLGHHSEVAWALWICKELDLPLKAEMVAVVALMRSSVCALLLLELQSLGRLPVPVDMSYWSTFNSPAALWDDLWLLAYEAGVRGWGGYDDTQVAADRHFNELKMRGVRFYDGHRALAPLFIVDEGAFKLIEGQEADINLLFFERSDANDFIEFQEDEGEYGTAKNEDEESKDEIDDFDLF